MPNDKEREGFFDRLKGKAEKIYGELTDDTHAKVHGQVDETRGKIEGLQGKVDDAAAKSSDAAAASAKDVADATKDMLDKH